MNNYASIRYASARLFFERGYHAASMRAIARLAKVQPASVYYHFRSKQDLLFTILNDDMDERISQANAIAGDNSNPVGQLQRFVESHVLLSGGHPFENMVADSELRALTSRSRGRIVAKRDMYQGILEGILQRGVEERLFHLEDMKMTAFAILAMCNQVGLWYRPSGRLSLTEIACLFGELAVGAAGGVPLAQRRAEAGGILALPSEKGRPEGDGSAQSSS